MFDARRRALDTEAQRAGHARCNGLFIEADNPYRIPPELRAQEGLTAMDTEDRVRMVAHLGFKRVDVTYVQAPLSAGKRGSQLAGAAKAHNPRRTFAKLVCSGEGSAP